MYAPDIIKQAQKRVKIALKNCLPTDHAGLKQLHRAMHYSVLNGGKRIRAALVYATGEALGANVSVLDKISTVVEIIHAFTLIHDDLPALDNDDLRRGKPTCHKKFGEATAILAGDALHAYGFKILATLQTKKITPRIQVTMLKILAETVGSKGLIGGEFLDIQMEKQKVAIKALETTYQLKTAHLIRASVLLAALAAGCEDKMVLLSLKNFGDCIGLAFQIHDDIIGIESDSNTLGKPQGSDVLRNKPTYPSLLGLKQAKKKRDYFFNKAMSHLDKMKINTEKLQAIASYVINRSF